MWCYAPGFALEKQVKFRWGGVFFFKIYLVFLAFFCMGTFINLIQLAFIYI